MKKPAILVLACVLLFTTTWSQNFTGRKTGVIDSASAEIAAGATDLPLFSSTEDGEKIVSEIMDAMGLEASFRIKTANVPNVEATIKHHERYILYNPEFISKVNTATKSKWASIFILAHEVGHHLDGHTEAGLKSCPAIELEADQFAGFVLCKMGATLEQAQLAMHYISNMASSKTHPGRLDRLAAIETGWNKAETQKQLSLASIPSMQGSF